MVNPTAADHRGHDLDRLQLVRSAVERVAREDDEVGEVAGEKLPAAALVPGQPRRVDDRRDEGLLDGQALFRVPRGALVDRAEHSRSNAGEGVELLDGRVGAVGEERARLPERPERVRTVDAIRPEALGEIAVGGGVAELDRARNAELREPADVLRGEALRVLHPVTQTKRRPG